MISECYNKSSKNLQKPVFIVAKINSIVIINQRREVLADAQNLQGPIYASLTRHQKANLNHHLPTNQTNTRIGRKVVIFILARTRDTKQGGFSAHRIGLSFYQEVQP